MLTTLLILLILGVALLGFGMWQFSRHVASLGHTLDLATDPAPATPPEPLRAAALRAGALPDDLATHITLTQTAEMRPKRDGTWQPLTARQTITTGAPGFVWVAGRRLGPLWLLRVTDSFANNRGGLQVWLAGALRIVRAFGPLVDEGEVMRYLAELPWAPDAILGNRAIVWAMTGPNTATATLGDATVTFTLDDQGDIISVSALRPLVNPDGTFQRLEWRGNFRDYTNIGPRRVPREAEVGWVYDTGYQAYFRGTITQLDVIHGD